MNNLRLIDIANKIFPSFGFFGSDAPFCLDISIGDYINSIDISIKGPHPDYLNITAIQVFSPDGKEYNLYEVVKSVVMSSIFESNSMQDGFSLIAKGEPIHTEEEPEPSVKIYFHEALSVGRIVIKNRPDIFGRRSTFLICKVESQGCSLLKFENSSESRKLEALDKLSRTLALDIESNSDDINTILYKIRKSLISRLQLNSDDFDFLELCRFLPIFNPPPTLTKFQVVVCSTIVLKLLGNAESVGTVLLRSLQSLLFSSALIKQVEREASSLLRIKTGQNKNIVFSKHVIQTSGIRENKERYLVAIDEAVRLFNELSVTIMMCYGTLLGAVRDGDFIANDDDVDFLVWDGSNSEEEAIAKRDCLISKINSRGYSTTICPGGNFHIEFMSAPLDFFICWKEADRVVLLMEEYSYRSIDYSIVYPPSDFVFFGRKLKALNKPKTFLAERYGNDWEIPSPFYEWPWMIVS